MNAVKVRSVPRNGALGSAASVALAWSLTLSCAVPGRGQAADPWIGTRVVAKAGGVQLKVGNQVVAAEDVHRIDRLERVNGPWFWVGTGGWARRTEAVSFDQAIGHFTDEIRNHPDGAWAYNLRAIIRDDKTEDERAIADDNEAIRLDSTDEAAFLFRGIAWMAKAEYDRAIADFGEAIRLDPKDAAAYFHRGDAWSEKEDHDRAIADYSEAIRLDPTDAAAYFNRGYTWGDKKDYDRAIADYSEVIRLDPEDMAAHINRGLDWKAKKAYDRAVADYGEAMRLDPKNAAGYGCRAWLWATCPDETFRDGKRAVEFATRACELSGWKAAHDLDTLAAAHAEAGNFDAAVRWQTKTLEILPKDDKDFEDYRDRLKLYQDKKPYRDEPQVP